MTLQNIKFDAEGLVPVVVQDVQSKQVLMLAYMNEESLKLSQETGYTWFWSRSRQELWNKGATSGHKQKIASMSYDCDGDTLLVLVEQIGPACHTGSYSCFTHPLQVNGVETVTMTQEADRFAILNELELEIAKRYAERPEGSYTSYLFNKGVDKILKKVGEEASEVIIAAKNEDNKELASEASDLLFHLMVLLRQRNLPIDELMHVLRERQGKPTTNKMR